MQEFEGESWQAAGYGYTLEDETAVCFCVFNSNNGNSEWYGFKIPKSDSVSGKQQVVAESMHDTRGDSNLIKIGKQGPLATLAYNRHVNSVALGSILYCIGIDRSIGIEESIDMESIGIDNIIQMDHCIGVEEIGHIDYSIGIDGSIRIDDSIGIDRSIGIDEISPIDYSIGSDESAGIDDSIGIDLESIGMDESIDIDEIIYIDDSIGIDESKIQNLPGHYTSDVYCFDINCPAQGWYQGPSMMAPRFLPDILVMDGKLYVMGGVDAINFEVPWAEVFDPITQKWEPLPDPPPTIRKSRLVYAACHDDGESKILVGTYTYDKKDSLYEYNVANKCWRQLPGHEMSFGYSGPAVAFGNKLYWFTETGHLFAYDLLQKLLYKCHVDKRLKDIGHHFNLVHFGGDQLCLLWISGVIDPNSNSDSDYEFESDSGSARGSCFHCYQFEVSMGIKNRKECLKACKNTCQSFIIDEEVSFVDGLLLSIKAQRSTLSNYVENDRFSSGLQLANLVVNSNLLNHSWDAILATSKVNPNEQQSSSFSLKYYVYQQSNCTIIAFITSPIGTKHHLEDGKELVSSATFKDTFPLFEFLCTEGNSSFSIHRAAITCFANSYNELSELKGQLGNACPLIITGHSLGGSIASLFTLWLLENSKAVDAKRPFCITFGAPLLGDDGLQKAIVGHSTWNSCFLHVAANQDPVPRLFILPHNPPAINAPSQTNVYKPFGSYLLCSEMGSTCLEDPEAITVAMGLQNSMNQQPIEEFLIIDYGRIIEFLKSRVIFKGTSQLGELITQSHRAGISLQLEAIGVNRTQQQQQNIDVNILIIKMEDWEKACMLKKRQAVDGIRKLNHVKIRMSYLEWYKKDSSDMEIGYYDRYMNMGKSEQEVVKCKKFLTDYWKKLIEEAEILKTQKEGVSFRGNKWVFGGTNYRRMVEPLDIAEYYKESGRRDYITNGRSQHYIELEKLQADAEKPSDSSVDLKKGNVKAILTEDSCFWAYVEEALISCRLLNNGDSIEMSRENLIKFEDYILHNLQNYSVSPEIFLPNSSFMKWWREYNRIMGTSYNSSLSEIMRTRRYHLYATGEL